MIKSIGRQKVARIVSENTNSSAQQARKEFTLQGTSTVNDVHVYILTYNCHAETS